MRVLKHVGKQPLKFSLEAYICDVRGLPSDCSEVALSWERGGKQTVATRTVPTQTTGSEERTAMIDDTLRMQCTLYRSARRATFDPKPTLLRVLDMSGGPYVSPTVLGTADFELSEHADLNADSPAKSKQLRLPRAMLRRGDGSADAMLTLQMTIKSQWMQGEGSGEQSSRDSGSAYPKLDGSGGSSNASGSAASSALTHEALQALEAVHSAAPASVANSSNPSSDRNALQRSGSFERKLRGGKGRESSRVAELSQLVASAAADARAAESRLAACQFRLRTEVMESLEHYLQQSQDAKKVEELVKAHQKQLVHTLDQVGRIASDNGGSIGGSSRGGGVSPLEAEVLSLRRELADTKVDVARLMGENEELNHVAKVLNKQLAELARTGTSAIAR